MNKNIFKIILSYIFQNIAKILKTVYYISNLSCTTPKIVYQTTFFDKEQSLVGEHQ